MRSRAQTLHRVAHVCGVGHRLEARLQIALGLDRLRKEAAQGRIGRSRCESEAGCGNQEGGEQRAHQFSPLGNNTGGQ